MNPIPANGEFDRLLSRMTEARLEAEEIRTLARFIEVDAELRQRYLDYCQMHAILLSEHGILASTMEQGENRLGNRWVSIDWRVGIAKYSLPCALP